VTVRLERREAEPHRVRHRHRHPRDVLPPSSRVFAMVGASTAAWASPSLAIAELHDGRIAPSEAKGGVSLPSSSRLMLPTDRGPIDKGFQTAWPHRYFTVFPG
jgi:hypothetical protein